jgi:acyl-coenzyme A thioesterase PaaI-like protein
MNDIIVKDDGNFHKECFACSQINEYGLQLQFESHGNQVTCHAKINKPHQGYNGVAHGGIIATLLDAAMVHCLHKKFGKNPLTCRLDIRYREVVPTDSSITINASFTSQRGKHCWVEANIISNDQVCVTAKGIFKLT